MIMLRPDYLLFGYRLLMVDENKTATAVSILLRNGISSVIKLGGVIAVKERDVQNIENIFSGRIDCSISKPLGLYGKWKCVRNKPAVLLGLLLSVIIILLSSQIVWDIRVEGNDMLADAEITYRLSNAGLSIGDFWRTKDLARVENQFLSKYRDVAWININRRGTVIYVKISENENQYQENDEGLIQFSNILSERDAVIEEIHLISGSTVVKPGDTVKTGDPLIIGTLSNSADAKFCRAQGTIKGRISDTVNVSVEREYEKKSIKGQRIVSVKIKVFNFFINIFKTYGNLTDNCDIIEDEKEYSLVGGAKLPISVVLEYTPIYETETVTLTDEELVDIASDRLRLATITRIAEADLVRLSTKGQFTDTGYTMSNDIIYVIDIGSERAFDISYQ